MLKALERVKGACFVKLVSWVSLFGEDGRVHGWHSVNALIGEMDWLLSY